MQDKWTIEYEEAYHAVRAATERYHRISGDYHAMRIGDDEFLKARTEYVEAEAAFDHAYDAAQS